MRSGKQFNFIHQEANLSARAIYLSSESDNSALIFFDLCFLQLLNFFKEKEQLGIYFDAENQQLQYKLEASTSGSYRSVLLADPNSFNPLMTGNIRLIKYQPGKQVPAESIVRAENLSVRDMVMEIISQSYQISSALTLQAEKNQSILLTALPGQEDDNNLENYVTSNNDRIVELSKFDFQNEQNLIAEFENCNFKHLTIQDIEMYCPCSKENMILNLRRLSRVNLDSIFEGDNTPAIANCDYCQTSYEILKSEV